MKALGAGPGRLPALPATAARLRPGPDGESVTESARRRDPCVMLSPIAWHQGHGSAPGGGWGGGRRDGGALGDVERLRTALAWTDAARADRGLGAPRGLRARASRRGGRPDRRGRRAGDVAATRGFDSARGGRRPRRD